MRKRVRSGRLQVSKGKKGSQHSRPAERKGKPWELELPTSGKETLGYKGDSTRFRASFTSAVFVRRCVTRGKGEKREPSAPSDPSHHVSRTNGGRAFPTSGNHVACCWCCGARCITTTVPSSPGTDCHGRARFQNIPPLAGLVRLLPAGKASTYLLCSPGRSPEALEGNYREA